MRRLVLLALLAALVLVPTAGSSGYQDLDLSFHSTAVAGDLRFAVVLPSDYATSGLRYPVVYFLHGLPASSSGYQGSVAIVERALAQTGRQAIVVAPQAARANDSDPEYHDWGPGRNWETAVAGELPAWIDAHFRTIANRSGRAVVGVSAGGYGAALLGLHHLDRFAVVMSWGGYFHPTDPSGLHALSVGSPAANARASAHTYVPTLRRALAARPTLLAFYVGDEDSRFRPENVQFHRELQAAHVPHVFRIYSGGHTSALWNAHAGAWLDLALSRLSPVRAS